MSTPSSSRKLLILFGIVPRDPNQRPLTVNSLSPKKPKARAEGRGWIDGNLARLTRRIISQDTGHRTQELTNGPGTHGRRMCVPGQLRLIV
ncbi:unnamed protein product [Nezara viridula]|uniref:Uncharacterized protein n=1 Tax=Nezara viridula TaxID=85310 RepID=A0A9P0MVX4_NEZVI|nr:unnamed protein product [Nezara viridula]